MLKTAAGILLTVGGFYFIICLFAFLFQSSLVYFPSRMMLATPDMRSMHYEDVWFTTEDGLNLHGWFVPAEHPRGTLLMFHGNAGNISGRLESIFQFHNLDLNVFIIDYRGYGKSEGRVTEQGTYKDAKAAWNWLISEKNIPPQQIILFGRSLGGGVASWLAVQEDVKPAGVFLESTFTSIPDLGAQLYPILPVRFMSRIFYPNEDRIRHIDVPLVIAHSPDDEIIPYHHGESLKIAAGDKAEFFEMRGGHNDGWMMSGAEYLMLWDNFIKKTVPAD